MGTLWTITVFASGEETAELALDASFEELDALNLVMSDYLPASEVRGVTTEWRALSAPLSEVLHESIIVAEGTAGAFDPALGALTKLWRRALRKRELPPASAIGDALKKSGYRNLMLRKGSVRLGREGVLIDLGGIGKGYAMAKVGKLLQETYGISAFLIDGGGDVFAGDAPPGAAGWVIEIRGNGAPFAVNVEKVAVMTSGDLHKYAVIGEKRLSHIIDPTTGFALEGSASATIIAASPTRADALASALCVVPSRAVAERYLDALAPGSAVRVSKAGEPVWERGLEPFRTMGSDFQEKEQ